MLNPYECIEARIEDIVTETPTIKTFAIKPKEKINFSPGQFIQLSIKGVGEAAFSLSSSPYQTNYLEITVMNAGRVTDRLHRLKKSNVVGIRGPYGKGYPVDRLYNREIIVVAGGIGIAGLRSFLLTLLAQSERFKRIRLYYGSQTPQDVVYKDAFKRWMSEKDIEIYRTVEKADASWKECEGDVDILLDNLKTSADSAAFVCGPTAMMKSCILKLIHLGQKTENIYLSIERNMCCGIGKCGHCAFGRFYVCRDGPVFNYEEIKDVHEIWD